MIVCVCNNVSDRKIRAAIDQGANSMRDLRSELQVGTCCGKCHSCAKSLLRDCLEQKESQQTVFFQPGAAMA